MLSSVRKSAIWKVVYRGLAFCMVIMIMLGTLPMGIAQADSAQNLMGVQAPAAITPESQTSLGAAQAVQTYPPQTGEDSATQSYQPPEYSPFAQQTTTSFSSAPFNGMDVDEPIPGMTPSGDLLIRGASTGGGSLPTSANTEPVLISINEITFNPSGPEFKNGKLNPFSVPAIREAMNILIDREYISEQIFDGSHEERWLPISKYGQFYEMFSLAAQDLEEIYAHNFSTAEATITQEMLALGATKNEDDEWYYDDEPVELIFLIRIEDERMQIGDYVSGLLEDIGFHVDRQYKTSSEASPVWLLGDPQDGEWHLYTGGWQGFGDETEIENFQFYYTPDGLDFPLWQAYEPTQEFWDLANLLADHWNDLEPEDDPIGLFIQALEWALEDSVRIWLVEELIEPSYELYLNVNYGHDWIEGSYPPGYQVTLTVYAANKTTVKGTASGITGEIPWWGGGTGFSTNHNMTWVGDRPNIEAGDWVVGDVTVGEDPYHAEVQLGTIAGDVDLDANSITGTVDAPWLPQDVPVEVQCHAWGAPEGAEGKSDSVLPNNIDTYSCAWDPATEWDIQPGQNIAVLYRDPGGHWVYSVHKGYSDELIMNIHYDHNWVEGAYKPGHTVDLTLYNNEDDPKAKAHYSVETGYAWDWNSDTGFFTQQELWEPPYPDIQPYDRVDGSIDGGAFTASVMVGRITGEADIDNDTVTGTIDAPWLGDVEVVVGCYIWEEGGLNVYTTVDPDGVTPYTCEFKDDDTYDLEPGTNLMVAYFEPAGHQIIGEFRPPAPHLRVEKEYMGGGSPGVGSYAEFIIWYANHGELPAEDVVITDTMDGFIYISDTSEIDHLNVYGDEVVTWELGMVEQGDWISFSVFAEVTGAVYDPELDNKVSNVAEITTSNIYDQGDPSEKRSEWNGTVQENTTDLNVGINPWTWNPAAGENFVYTVGVCNNGETGSLPITLDISFVENLTLYDGPFGVWWAREPGWQEVYSDSGQLTLSRPTISGGHCLEVYVRVTVDVLAESGDELYTEAAVSTANETNPGDNETSVRHHVGDPYTDLEIWQNWHWGSLVPGGYYRYSINFRNSGNLPVSDSIAVTATLPPGTSFAGWDKWGWASVADPDVNGQSITWQVNVRDPGFMGTIEVWVKINPATLPGTELLHLAEIEVQPEENNTENNESSLIEQVYPYGPNLRVYKRGEWHSHEEDKYAWYEVRVENIGDQTVQDVAITDIFPEGMTLRDGPDVHFWEGSECNDDEFGFVCTLDRLEPGWNMSVYFTLTPDTLTPGEIYINTVTVAPNVRSDVNPDDNEASYELASGPDMFIEKTLVEGDFQPGTEVTYLLTFGNAQTAWWWGMAGNAIITDILPEGMTFVSAQLRWCEEEWCEIEPDINGQELTWNLYPIGAGNWNEIRLTVLIDEGVEKDNPLINVATIATSEHASDIDPYPDNNRSTHDPELRSSFNIFLPLILR